MKLEIKQRKKMKRNLVMKNMASINGMIRSPYSKKSNNNIDSDISKSSKHK
jgi:hypothetical protein